MSVSKHCVNKVFSISLLIILLSVLFSFQSSPLSITEMAGNWNANWKIKNETVDSSNQMKGRMSFRKDGTVQLCAYGYPGCIFSNDTIENNLSWTIKHDSLFLFNNKDQFSLSYAIRKSDKNELLLQLMDDIYVSLKRVQK